MTPNRRYRVRLVDVARVSGRQDFAITTSTFNIGRSIKNDVVIKQTTVSGKHAVIEEKPDGYYIRDLNSTNKTLFNGTALEPNRPQRLNDGDKFTIDEYDFIFKLEKLAQPQPKPAPPKPRPVAPKPAPMQPVDDGDETVFLGGDDMVRTPESPPPPPPAADSDETVFFDSSAMADEPAAPALPPQPEADGDETVFFDSSAAADEPAAPALPPQPEADGDETVFFDSDAMMDDSDSAPLLSDSADENPTMIRPKPADEDEIKLIGSYKVEKLLGKGGFGSVWKARNKEGEPIAIKVLNPDVLENERAVRKFFHEAIILSRLDHPNICRFIDFFPHEENYAIVMDFVQGTDLKDMLEERKGPLPFDLACKVSAEALDAFHYAHLMNVLHRDIKPENITLDHDGTAKVMDFGIAKLSSTESHQTSLFMISPAYTAPERFDAKKTELVDHRSDIYSLGLVFYELFTGSHPFPTTNPTEMIISHMNKVPTPPDEVAEVPSEISDAIVRALEKDPDERFEDFAAFKMAMLGEVPRVSGGLSKTVGALSFSGEHCKGGAKILRALSDLVRKHQKKAKKITLAQEGGEVHIVIETLGGNSIRITRDLDKIINQRMTLF